MFEVPPVGRSKVPNLQGLGISHLDSLWFSHGFGRLPGDVRTGGPKKHHSVGVGCGPEGYALIAPEHEREGGKPIPDPTATRGSPFLGMSQVVEADHSPRSTPSLLSGSTSDTTSLSDFLFDSAALEEGFGPCIRCSDGRLYAIKKVLQTRRAWSELTILRKIKENQVSFNQWLYWAFERDRCIYFIVENCPSGSLADAVIRYGMLGSSVVLFFACEIIMGLRSLHDVGIIHHNVSPNTIAFDRYGCLHDIPETEDKDYQAPELLSGWNHDILVDSWSFGMVLYFMFHGKHAFLPGNGDTGLGQITKKVLSGELLNKAIQLVDPIARDLILKPNPALRPTVHSIQRHPYFSNVDWGTVLKQETPGPLPREFLASNLVRSTTRKTRGANLLGLERHFPLQLEPPMPGGRQLVSSQTPPVLFGSPLAGLKAQVETRTSLRSTWSAVSPNVSMDGLDGAHTPDLRTPRYEVDLWNALSCGDSLSPGLCSSSDIKLPSSRTWNLPKKCSRVINPRRYHDLKAAIHKKFRKKPESIVARKCASYAQPIMNLPRGLNQVGSGIGFTYTECAAPTTAGILNTGFPRFFRLVGSGSRNERDSNLSESLSSVPKSCGLFHGLNMSDFWAGFKSGSAAPPRVSASSKAAQAQDKSTLDITLDLALGPSDPLPGKSEGRESSFSGIIQPLAESTAHFPRPKSLFSLLATPTEPAAGAGEVLAHHGFTVPREAIFGPEDEMVELKKLEEDGLAPESTLRLVTGLNNLWLSC